MRYSFIILLFTLFACQENGHKDVNTLPSMTGGLNEIVIVLEEHFWQGDIGDSLRAVLGAEVQGIPWQESIFDLVQIPPKAYTRIFETHRNLLFFEKGNKASVGFQENTNAKGQLIALVTYQNKDELKILLNQYASVIVDRFQEQEKARLKTQMVLQTGLEKVFQKHEIDLKIPKDFSLVLDTTDFTWIEYSPKEKEIIQGVFIYEINLETPFTTWQLLAQRDSLAKRYVQGETTDSYMAVETKHYQPWIKHTESMGCNALEIKGLWKMQNAFMGGPFITHFIQDTTGNRILAIEGFLFNPGEDKRDKMQLLQLVLESAKKRPAKSE
tara:strand:- start:2857 stop:3837 length:981 start_codon:yes stop_codon:yes gene_type:complete